MKRYEIIKGKWIKKLTINEEELFAVKVDSIKFITCDYNDSQVLTCYTIHLGLSSNTGLTFNYHIKDKSDYLEDKLTFENLLFNQ